MRPTDTHDVTAFCSTCPDASEVTALLQSLGFRLVFEMEADDEQAYLHLPPLPAQFHYDGPQGTSVVFLAGKDVDIDGLSVPPHASRFWAYAGSDQDTLLRVTTALAARWTLTWQHADAPPQQFQEIA